MQSPLFTKVPQLIWQSCDMQFFQIWILDHPLFISLRLYSMSGIRWPPTTAQKHIVLHKHMQTPTRFLLSELGALKFCALFLNFHSIWNFDSDATTNTRSSGQVVRHPTFYSLFTKRFGRAFFQRNYGYKHAHSLTHTHLLSLIERD